MFCLVANDWAKTQCFSNVTAQHDAQVVPPHKEFVLTHRAYAVAKARHMPTAYAWKVARVITKYYLDDSALSGARRNHVRQPPATTENLLSDPYVVVVKLEIMASFSQDTNHAI